MTAHPVQGNAHTGGDRRGVVGLCLKAWAGQVRLPRANVPLGDQNALAKRPTSARDLSVRVWRVAAPARVAPDKKGTFAAEPHLFSPPRSGTATGHTATCAIRAV